MKHTITIIDNVPIEKGARLRVLYGDAVSRIENVRSSLRKSPKTLEARSLAGSGSKVRYRSNVTPQVFQGMAQVPASRVVGRSQFRDQRRRVGAGRKFRLRMGCEALYQVVDVHMGEPNDADTKKICHG